jgi:hypothetical protein
VTPSAGTVPVGNTDLGSTLGSLRMLSGDPTVAAAPGRFTRATWTPDGPGTVAVTWQPGGPEARVEAHGDGDGRPLSYEVFHRHGIERHRADTLRAAANAAGRLGPLVDGGLAAALPALRAVRGVGPWTASCLAAQTWGDRDAVVVGDSGIPSIVGWPPAREERADDDRMIALLEPHRPHRYRVLRLAMAAGDGGWGWRLGMAAGVHPPRRAPRGRRTDIRRH